MLNHTAPNQRKKLFTHTANHEMLSLQAHRVSATLRHTFGRAPRRVLAAAAGADRQASLKQVNTDLGTDKLGVPEVEMAEVVRRFDAKDSSLVLVDVRSAEERAVSTIPGSVTVASVLANKDAYADKSLVTFCTVGYLAAAAARDLSSQAIGRTVKNLGDGSLLGWTLAGKPLVKPDGSAATGVHTFMAGLAGLAAPGLETTSFPDEEAGTRLAAAKAHYGLS